MRIWIAPDDSTDRLDAEEVTATVHHEYKIEGDPGHGYPHYRHIFHDHTLYEQFKTQREDPTREPWPEISYETRTVITTAWEPAS